MKFCPKNRNFFELYLSNSLQYRVIVLACEQALSISAEGRAILRLREDLRRVGERFVGGLVSISVPDPSLARVSRASYAFMTIGSDWTQTFQVFVSQLHQNVWVNGVLLFVLQALSAEASEILPQYTRRTPKNYEEVRLSAQHCRDWSSSKFYGYGNKFMSTYQGMMRARRLHNSRRTANSSWIGSPLGSNVQTAVLY